ENIAAIHDVPSDKILAAAFAAAAKAGGAPGNPSRLAPVVDGGALPSDPFTPAAPAISANVPVMIGWNKDEWSLFAASEPWFGKLTEAELAERAKQVAGDKAEALLAAFKKLHPDYSPTYLMNDFTTNMRMFIGSVTLAERKAAQNAAPVYLYNLVWETPVGGGIFKSPHTLEMPFVFNNVDKSRPLVGPGDAPEKMAAQMSDAWIAFARTGDPNTASIPKWPPYDAKRRATMTFDIESKVVDDPLSEVRKILQG
ncbi:MAG: carboxylesterase family protein, partial [Candidatus Hydrogenedentota bacterium]